MVARGVRLVLFSTPEPINHHSLERSHDLARRLNSVRYCSSQTCPTDGHVATFNLVLMIIRSEDLFGSKRLIEILNAHGLCATYTELRRYLISVANHEIDRISGDRYIPVKDDVVSSIVKDLSVPRLIRSEP
jgi:hypothetical protein